MPRIDKVKKKPYAVYTLAHNEEVFLPIWLNYYSRYFAPDDIYVIDHDSNDGSIKEAKKKYKFNVENVHYPSVHNNEFMRRTISKMQRSLLKKYDIVIYCDADELIIADPIKYKNIKEYIDGFKTSVVSCNSRSLAMYEHDLPIDLSKPILSQRSIWFSEYLYNKPLISRIPLNWSNGLHQVLDGSNNRYVIPIDRNLVLLHLSRMDFSIREHRGQKIFKEQWGAKGIDAMQWQLKGQKLKDWFYIHPKLTISDAPKGQLSYDDHENYTNLLIEFIPDRFKNIV